MRVGVAGASGYTGAELLRLCAAHPQLDVVYAGASMRYVVTLDAGPLFVVTQTNAGAGDGGGDGGGDIATALRRGSRTRLIWKADNAFRLG